MTSFVIDASSLRRWAIRSPINDPLDMRHIWPLVYTGQIPLARSAHLLEVSQTAFKLERQGVGAIVAPSENIPSPKPGNFLARSRDTHPRQRRSSSRRPALDVVPRLLKTWPGGTGWGATVATLTAGLASTALVCTGRRIGRVRKFASRDSRARRN
jgi:hypothetical protein